MPHNDNISGLLIPHDQLSSEALQGLIQEFVTRDGTDYGLHEVSLEAKMTSVRTQLQRGTAVIVFDPDTGTCNILPADHPAVRVLRKRPE